MKYKLIDSKNKTVKELFDKFSREGILDELSKLDPKEKDFILALLISSATDIANATTKIVNILSKIINIIGENKGKNKNLNKEIKEIENSLSVGIPGWIKYTRKTKKTKK